MGKPSVTYSTFVIERRYPATPERVFAAFAGDTPFPGVALTNQTNYRDIVPSRRIVFAYTMTLGKRRISASLATIELLPADSGTHLIFTEQCPFFEGADGPQMRKQRWRHNLGRLDGELK